MKRLWSEPKELKPKEPKPIPTQCINCRKRNTLRGGHYHICGIFMRLCEESIENCRNPWLMEPFLAGQTVVLRKRDKDLPMDQIALVVETPREESPYVLCQVGKIKYLLEKQNLRIIKEDK